MASSTPESTPASQQRSVPPLRHRTFRRVLTIGSFYYTYRATELAVLSWFVLTLTDSDLMVSLVGVSRVAPMFLFGLTAGGLADRIARKRLMISAQVVNLLASVAMVTVLALGFAEPWFAYPAIFATGSMWAIDYAARRALLGDLFSGRSLTSATSIDAGLVTGANMVGPLFGTALVRYFDFAGAYAGIVVLSFSGVLLAMTIRVGPGQVRASRAGPARQVANAARLMRRNRTVLGAVLLTAALNFFGFPFVQLVPVVARETFGASEVAYGLLVSGLGLGALAGSVLIASLQPVRKGNVYSLGAALLMAAAIGFVSVPWYPVAFILMVFAGVGLAGFAAMQPAIPLEAVKPEERGQAMGAIVLGIGLQSPGMLLMGVIAEFFGPRVSITVLGVSGLLCVVLLRRLFPALADAKERS